MIEKEEVPLKAGQTIGQFPMVTFKPNENTLYGLHTFPKEFWTSGKPSIRADPDYQQRRTLKSARHEKNEIARADANRKRGSRQ